MTKKHTRRPKVIVKRSSAGLGLFAVAPIKKGSFVIEYTGEKIRTAEADRRGGQYLFTLNDDWVIDAKSRAHKARYINHSCRPNCEAEIDEDTWKINIYALRDIRAGEELSYHYGKEFWEEHVKPKGCRCVKCSEKKKNKRTK